MSDSACQASCASAAETALAEHIDALLPQTQCARCGYDGCRPYATAIAQGTVPINRCPPGGQRGIEALAALLQRPVLALDPRCGDEADPGVAWIKADACIGCARCLPVCPVDAIIGAQRYLHTVYAPHCTGCELCIASCPVDCIVMQPRAADEVAPDQLDNRRHAENHQARGARQARERAVLLAQRKHASTAATAEAPIPQ